MNIAVFCELGSSYSGGRYLAWAMTEAIAQLGHNVTFISNRMPFCYDDFTGYSRHNSIEFDLQSWGKKLDKNFDLVVFVPSGASPKHYLRVASLIKRRLVASNLTRSQYYTSAIEFCNKNQAKLLYLSFETPNWPGNPRVHDPSFWELDHQLTENASIILSISNIGNNYAKSFFTRAPENCIFDFCHPGINSRVADAVVADRKKNQIVFVSRLDSYKNWDKILGLFDRKTKPDTCVFIGNSHIINKLRLKLLGLLSNIHIEIKSNISDSEKFRLIKESQIMVFPSMFEGYGFPPVEAQYCNTPCIAFDLPVLREVSDKGLYYAEPDNFIQMKEIVRKTILEPPRRDFKAGIYDVANFESYAASLGNIINRIV